MNLSQSFYVKPAAHEVVDTTVSLFLDQRPALVGTVVDGDDKPVEAALVTVYRADAPTRPISALYTDELGRFTFGPLESGKLYHIKVFKSTDGIRALEQG
ncbi:MAG: carboxypeptidase-like regulatory domain-containing protein [Eubacteriales bacterium]|nr:carboxypeptidase-like regulatory domain-containing protein [Eubacteriales bacterium]